MTSGGGGNSLSVDPEALRAVAARLAGFGDQAARILARLSDVMAQEGDCWGTDAPGEQFAKTYVSGAEQGTEGLRTLAGNLHSLGEGVANTVDTIEQQDAINAGGVNNAVADTVSPPPNVDSSPNAVPYSPAASGPQPPDSASTTTPPQSNSVRPSSSSRQPASPPTGSAQQPAATRRPVSSQQPASQPASPQSESSRPQSQQPSGAQPTSQQPTSGRPPGNQQSANPAAAIAGKNGAPPVSAAPNRALRPNPAASDATPWSKSAPPGSPPASPWSGSSSQGSSQQQPRPPSPEEPEEPHPRRPTGTDKKRKAEANKRSRESANARIARELAERHHIEVLGFTLPGVDEATVLEFAAAVDDVLGRHPNIGLRGVGIADLGDAAAQTEWDDGARIQLALAAAIDPAGYARTIAAATESGYLVRGCAERPVYSTVLREFGRVLDAAGGLRARAAAQKTLITEYVRVVAPDYHLDPLGRTVAGYREWRSQLSGCCFPDGQFDAGSAVAEAFVEAELHGEEASAQALSLHRLLVTSVPGTAPSGWASPAVPAEP